MSTRRLLVCTCLLLAATAARPARAQLLLRSEASVRLMEEGRGHLLSYRMPAAERAFRRLAARPDGAPAAFHFLSAAALHRAMMSDDEAHYEVFYGRIDTLAAFLDDAPDTHWRTYLEAEMYLQTVFAAIKQERFVRAALAARRAYKHYDRLVAEHPAFYEAYKGMGLLHLGLGALPSTYRGLLRLLGYGGTIEGGLHELGLAARESRYNSEEARVYDALARTILFRDHVTPLKAVEGLHQAHPDSPVFAHLYGFLLLSNRRAGEAVEVLKDAARRADDPDYLYIDYIDHFLAEALFKLNRFAEAETYYRRYLDRHDGPALEAMTYLDLGLSLEMQGRREEALHYYRRVDNRRGFDTDEVALHAAEKRLASPMTARERRLLLGRNAYDAGRYAEAEATLRDIHEDAAAPVPARVEAAYRLGRVYHAQGRLDEAVPVYRYAVDHAEDPRARWAPWSQFYIGEILAERGYTLPAAAAFERALSYDGKFDYYQALEQNVRAALERLEEEG